jgi:hypothetical protein
MKCYYTIRIIFINLAMLWVEYPPCPDNDLPNLPGFSPFQSNRRPTTPVDSG